ncbi:ferritin-like domain-containing protein [Sediminibacterium soli]|uniref:ferritin-like domain-containing protein n=1 Tax=Sediminibacterium soli TaxID=2698829 RepID=UPI0013796A2C|nr:ferritin-like domain-containing protein [Sediminibacterium soli]NCI46244.1 ferritin-like domain-containing protein [Sediminibacterium soli]
MNLQQIFSEIEETDPAFYDRTSGRRQAFKHFSSVGTRISLAALPLALGSFFRKAYGQTTTGAIGVLNFALQLEYLEANFYVKGVATAGLIPAGPALTALTAIRDHENAHVGFLRNAIVAAGGTPYTYTAANFDFTAKGAFPDVFTNYATFLAVAQALEDTGVRAYKGQAGNLMGNANRPLLTAALNIHSVEARHASHIRQMRAAQGVAVKPWITGNTSGIDARTNGNYAGEENTIQGGVNITGLPGVSGTLSAAVASESFDEPLTKDQVVALVTPFFA